jgi:hypothetical protein
MRRLTRLRHICADRQLRGITRAGVVMAFTDLNTATASTA